MVQAIRVVRERGHMGAGSNGRRPPGGKRKGPCEGRGKGYMRVGRERGNVIGGERVP
jgi:hypothetical protein